VVIKGSVEVAIKVHLPAVQSICIADADMFECFVINSNDSYY